MVVGVPISNFLAEHISLSVSMSFFALTTFFVMMATAFFVPSMPAEGRSSYGEQLAVLKKPMVWASIFAILFLNGSVFGVFNYWAAYLANVVGLAPNLVSLLLFGYGLCNIFGSMAAGHLLSSRAEDTVKIFSLLAGSRVSPVPYGRGQWTDGGRPYDFLGNPGRYQRQHPINSGSPTRRWRPLILPTASSLRPLISEPWQLRR